MIAPLGENSDDRLFTSGNTESEETFFAGYLKETAIVGPWYLQGIWSRQTMRVRCLANLDLIPPKANFI